MRKPSLELISNIKTESRQSEKIDNSQANSKIPPKIQPKSSLIAKNTFETHLQLKNARHKRRALLIMP